VQLERLSVALRPRGGWEALDLGFQMARGWWRPVWGTWLAVYLPAAAVLHAVFQETLWLAPLALWWLKPVFDRFVLHVVSRAVFGAPPTVAEALRAWRDVLRPGVFAGLALFRLDPARSFNMPVWQLEKQTGREASARRGALGRRMRGYAVWLTVLCLHFEALALASLGLLVALLVPAGGEAGFEFSELFKGGGTGEGARWDWFDSACYVAAVSLIEPLYVAAGFSLYLNRRAILEGWDIELALRRLDGRLRVPKAAVIACVALALACLAGSPPPAFAAERSAKQEIKEVLKAPEFQQSRERLTWRYRGERTKAEDAAGSDFWRNVGAFFAQISQTLLWIAVGIGIVALAVLARRQLAPFFEREADAYRPPDALFGLAVTPESLPDDVAGAAARLARAGRLREALSLLYRAALSVLVHRDHVPLAEGDTEGDCVRAARRALPRSGAEYFGRLVAAWERAAYAGRLPEASEAEALAREWAPHFAAPGTEGTAA
jgi:hypothetical protein